MRLTHYEDGFPCGERFCINLIRRLGDTFPDLGEGKDLDRLLAHSRNERFYPTLRLTIGGGDKGSLREGAGSEAD